jgi:peptidoglycan/LPS O-acetylase OafA/YrhL
MTQMKLTSEIKMRIAKERIMRITCIYIFVTLHFLVLIETLPQDFPPHISDSTTVLQEVYIYELGSVRSSTKLFQVAIYDIFTAMRKP